MKATDSIARILTDKKTKQLFEVFGHNTSIHWALPHPGTVTGSMWLRYDLMMWNKKNEQGLELELFLDPMLEQVRASIFSPCAYSENPDDCCVVVHIDVENDYWGWAECQAVHQVLLGALDKGWLDTAHGAGRKKPQMNEASR